MGKSSTMFREHCGPELRSTNTEYERLQESFSESSLQLTLPLPVKSDPTKPALFVSELQRMQTAITVATFLQTDPFEELLKSGLKQPLHSIESLKRIALSLKKTKVEKWWKPSSEPWIATYQSPSLAQHEERLFEQSQFQLFTSKGECITSEGSMN
jgi:hypothetical protein